MYSHPSSHTSADFICPLSVYAVQTQQLFKVEWMEVEFKASSLNLPLVEREENIARR